MTQRGAFVVELSIPDTSTHCLTNTPLPVGHDILQITTCGLSHGDVIYVNWSPADPGCTDGDEQELITVP